MRIASVRAALSSRTWRRRVELAVLLANLCLYLSGGLFGVEPVAGYRFCAAPSRSYGSLLRRTVRPESQRHAQDQGNSAGRLFTRQVTASRNVQHGLIVDTLFGGLNYQIEHHLFPSMPRPFLKKAAPLVRQFCREHDVPYVEMTVVRSYRQAFDYLHGIWREMPSERGD